MQAAKMFNVRISAVNIAIAIANAIVSAIFPIESTVTITFNILMLLLKHSTIPLYDRH